MTEVPKIVHHRLRAAELGRQAEQSHPEPDVLAAFAEQALSEAEREGVLGHLAHCTDCREVVTLALPAEEFVAAPVQAEAVEAQAEAAREPVALKARRNWFAWGDLFSSNLRFSNMRWAALAAGVAVALFVMYTGVERSGKPSVPGAVASQKAPATAAAPEQVASEVAPQSRLEAKAAETKPGVSSDLMKTAPAPKPAVGRAKASIADKRERELASADRQGNALAAGGFAGSAPAGANETVETSNATVEAATTSSSDLMAASQPLSVEKAKPALDEVTASETTKKEAPAARAPMALQANGVVAPQAGLPSTPTLKQGTFWTITAGVLQRSLDGGRNWQPVLQGAHPWLCYATHGQEVWAGGQAGALQRSADGGASWSTIAVSSQGKTLGADVIRVEAMDPAWVVLTTADHQTWTSADGGKSWERK
jgi:hypothetical protein